MNYEGRLIFVWFWFAFFFYWLSESLNTSDLLFILRKKKFQ